MGTAQQSGGELYPETREGIFGAWPMAPQGEVNQTDSGQTVEGTAPTDEEDTVVLPPPEGDYGWPEDEPRAWLLSESGGLEGPFEI